MQLYCPRCGGDLKKATYYDHFRDVTLKRALTWYARLAYEIIYFLQGEYRAFGPGLLRCAHCNYHDDNIPSSFYKPGSVMVPPRPAPEPKKVKTSIAIVIILFMLAVCIGIIILNAQLHK
jgi:hypothetical protein